MTDLFFFFFSLLLFQNQTEENQDNNLSFNEYTIEPVRLQKEDKPNTKTATSRIAAKPPMSPKSFTTPASLTFAEKLLRLRIARLQSKTEAQERQQFKKENNKRQQQQHADLESNKKESANSGVNNDPASTEGSTEEIERLQKCSLPSGSGTPDTSNESNESNEFLEISEKKKRKKKKKKKTYQFISCCFLTQDWYSKILYPPSFDLGFDPSLSYNIIERWEKGKLIQIRLNDSKCYRFGR